MMLQRIFLNETKVQYCRSNELFCCIDLSPGVADQELIFNDVVQSKKSECLVMNLAKICYRERR